MNHPEEIREALDRISASVGFRRSQRLVRLLRYTSEAALAGRTAELKETTLGVEVYDRGADFDPRVDGIVRVEANRLRRKLQEYYSGGGKSDPIRIEYAKGSYVPSFASTSPPALLAPSKHHIAVRLAALAAVLVLCTSAAWLVSRTGHGSDPHRPTFAVVPFRDLSADKSMEHVAAGVSDEIKTVLAAVPGVRVIARIPSGADHGKLGVDYLLEGDVRSAGIRAGQIEARLVRASDEVYVWSKSYSVGAAPVDDAEAVERQIVLDAARAAGVKGSPRPPSATAQPEDARARDLYLRGKFLLRLRGSQSAEAPALFEQAIQIDPGYAKAYAGLAEYHALRAANFVKPDGELPAGMAAAEKAVGLAPDLADAHSALGLLRYSAWDFDGALAEYAAALRLNPNLASAYNRRAVAEYALGEFAAAERDLFEAQGLDPFNLAHSATLGELYHSWRRFADEARVGREILAKDPRYDYGYKLLARSAFVQGRFDQAAAYIVRLSRLTDLPDQIVMSDRVHAARNLEDWRRTHSDCTATTLAYAYAMTGDSSRALQYLQSAFAERDPGLISIKWDAEFDAVRRDARFTAIVRAIDDRIARGGPQTLH